VIAGAVAMLSRKGHGRHSTAGRVYFWCLTALCVSVGFLAAMRWHETYALFWIGSAACACALFGRAAMRYRWPYRGRLHIVGMGSSYLLMIVAFYVDNGHQLPVWRDLPPVTYWLLPMAIGLPLIGRALLRHPLRTLGNPG
jgi:hypothetical protein